MPFVCGLMRDVRWDIRNDYPYDIRLWFKTIKLILYCIIDFIYLCVLNGIAFLQCNLFLYLFFFLKFFETGTWYAATQISINILFGCAHFVFVAFCVFHCYLSIIFFFVSDISSFLAIFRFCFNCCQHV